MTANPVLIKEIRTRLRSKKARTIQLAIGIPAVLVILACYVRLIMGLSALKDDVGEVWLMAAMLQLALISLLAPGLLANAISQEKEQRTWGLLLITRLSSWQIISGKLLARLVPIPIIMVLFVPFMAYSAFASGIKWQIMMGTYAILLSTVLLFAVQALFWSWVMKRTSTAVAASYGFVFLVTAGTGIVEGLANVATSRNSPTMLSWFNPFYAMGNLLDISSDSVYQDAVWQTIFFTFVSVAVSAVLLLIMKRWLNKVQAD